MCEFGQQAFILLCVLQRFFCQAVTGHLIFLTDFSKLDFSNSNEHHIIHYLFHGCDFRVVNIQKSLPIQNYLDSLQIYLQNSYNFKICMQL